MDDRSFLLVWLKLVMPIRLSGRTETSDNLMTNRNWPSRAHSPQPRLGIRSAAVAILVLNTLYSGTTVSAPPAVSAPQLTTPQGHRALIDRSKGASRAPTKAALAEWREIILHTPTPKKGCFSTSFPETKWHEIACTEPPPYKYKPAPTGGPHHTVGNTSGDAFSKLMSGHVSLARGFFDVVSGVTSASSAKYSLQINTHQLKTSACSASPTPSACYGVEQFVYNTDGNIYSQYWLGEYGPPGTPCPSPTGLNCASGNVSNDGWCPASVSGSNAVACVINGMATTVPAEPLTSLGNLHFSGLAGPNSDEVRLFDNGQAYSASGGNYFPDLGSLWLGAEFNVFGNHDGAVVQFNPGVTLRGNSTVEGPGADSLACVGASITVETNNLDMRGVTIANNSIIFVESNVPGSPIPPPAEAVTPAEGASNVAPWPTHLIWPVWPNETAWTIDVDTDNTFASPNHVPLKGGVLDTVTQSASIDANLLAGKTYYWRVAGNASTCPRFTHTFSTRAQRPTNLSPTGASNNVYPWRAEFIWQVPSGSESFDWVLTDPHHGNDSYTLQEHVPISQCAFPLCKVVRDVAVNSTVHWSVRAHGPTNLYQPNDGLEASAEMIMTSTPAAVITSSKRGDNPPTYPWDVPVQWEKLKGASQFALDVRDGFAGIKSPTGYFDGDKTSGSGVTKAHFDEDKALIHVSLTPIGPLIKPEIGKPFHDRGSPDTRFFSNRGSATIPCVKTPFEHCNTAPKWPHIGYGSLVDLSWTSVKQASGYAVYLYPIKHPQSLLPVATPSTVNFQAATMLGQFDDGQAIEHFELSSNFFSPALGKDTYGNWISVRAQGPSDLAVAGFPPEDQLSPVAHTNGAAPYLNDAFAHQNGDGAVYIDIPAPVIEQPIPYDAQTGLVGLEKDNNSGLPFFTVWWGQDPAIYAPVSVEFALFADADCSGTPLPGADDVYTSPLTYNRHHRPYVIPFQAFDRDLSLLLLAKSDAPEVSSQHQCQHIHTIAPRCGDGFIQSGEQCDDGDGHNGTIASSCTDKCKNVVHCNQAISSQGGHEGYKITMALGLPNAQATLYYNTLTIPDNVIVSTDGKEQWRSGCHGTHGTLSQPITGDSSAAGNVTIVIDTNCNDINQDKTEWAFEVHCNQDPTPTITHPDDKHPN